MTSEDLDGNEPVAANGSPDGEASAGLAPRRRRGRRPSVEPLDAALAPIAEPASGVVVAPVPEVPAPVAPTPASEVPTPAAPTPTTVAAEPAEPPKKKRGRKLRGGDGPVAAIPATVAAVRPPRKPFRERVTWETIAWLSLFMAAVLSRFWDLGSKALHHDESLHAYYSWLLATGQGYIHDPMMHGAFLYHMNALVYTLFGDSDASARYAPAFFGVLMVMMPWLLRGKAHLGRWGALLAGLFLLVSPSILYQSRYIRHDIYTIAGTLFLFICIVRYIDHAERKWLIGGAASIAFLLTNHEIVFAIIVIFFLYLYGALFYDRFKAWKGVHQKTVRGMIAAHIGLAVGMLGLLALAPSRYMEQLLDIPWENPTRDQEIDYYKSVFTNPLVIGAIIIFILFVIAMVYFLKPARDPEYIEEGWVESLLHDAPDGTVDYGVRSAWRDRTGLWIAVGVAVLIFVCLYTTFFTNVRGLFSSTISTDGTLLYWLGQHDFRRGEQPWFYYLLLMPQYDFIGFLLGWTMVGIMAWRGFKGLIGRGAGSNFFFRAFLAWWFVMIFAGVSYAGEKMPWLVVHPALPAALLAASLVGGVIDWVQADGLDALDGRGISFSRLEWGTTGLLLVSGIAWLLLAAHLTYGQFVDDPSRSVRRVSTPESADLWWLLALPALLALLVMGVSMFRRGVSRTGVAVLAALVIGLVGLQVHAGWRLAYYEADVPKDMLVYTQTSPDVTRVMDELDAFSEQQTGGKHMLVWYDSAVSWPFQWYLRDYDNKTFVGAQPSGQPGDVPIIIVGDGTATDFPGYTSTEYVLRWWFPEETYRNFAIAPELPPGRSAWQSEEQDHGIVALVESIFDTAGNSFTIDGQLRLYRLVMYRDLDWSIGQYNFRVFVRNDLLPEYNDIRY